MLDVNEKLKKFGFSIDVVPIDQLKFYEKNPRIHTEKSTKTLAKTMKNIGFKNIVMIDENNEIIYGHGRVLAAKEIGLKEIPAAKVSNLTPEQIKALRIADNKHTENSYWNVEFLKEEIDELKNLNFDISALGLDPQSIDRYFQTGKYQDIEIEKKYSILVDCSTEQEQKEVYEKFQEMNLQCRLLTL